MTIKALYPNVRPTLNLDFAKTKALDPRVTFTRASTATFVGSNGLIQTAASGAARFDHNPETGESLGLLVEEARTNNVLYSNGMNASVWWNYAYMISRTYNAGVSPDGTTTATLFTVNTNLQEHFLSGNTPSLPSAIYTHSIFAKQGTGSYNIQLRIGGVSEAPYIKFNFSTEQVTTNSSARVEKFPNGWYRLSVTSNVASTFSTAYIFMLNENNVGYYTGDGVSSSS
jgi:hypothetical protein